MECCSQCRPPVAVLRQIWNPISAHRIASATAVLATALGLAVPTGVEAGAWPRETGRYFLAFRSDGEVAGEGRDRSRSIYGEYGLTERVTLGGEWSDSSSIWTNARSGGFVRLAVGDLSAETRIAVSLGASSPPDAVDAVEGARIDFGAYVGRGFASRFGGGWATASWKLGVSATGHGTTVHDLGATIGLRPRDRMMTMLTASRHDDGTSSTVKLAPAFGFELREEVWGVVTYSEAVSGGDTRAIGLSVWISF